MSESKATRALRDIEELNFRDKARYRSLLKTGEWQCFAYDKKKSVGFRCEHCGTEPRSAGALQVHHPYYRPGRLPWQYHLSEVKCLCDRCHARWEAAMQTFRINVAWGLSAKDLAELIAAILRLSPVSGGLPGAVRRLCK